MDSWKSLVLVIAVLSIISVTSAQISATYYCQQDDAATGNLGSFVVTLAENNAITLSSIVYLSGSPLTPCGTLVLDSPSSGIKTLTSSIPSSNTGLPCGVQFSNYGLPATYAHHVQSAVSGKDFNSYTTCCWYKSCSDLISPTMDLGAGVYQLNFATRSLTEGYSSTNDKRFVINCPSFTSTTVDLPVDGFPVIGTLGNIVADVVVPDGLSMFLQFKDTAQAGAIYANVPSGTAAGVPITSKIRFVVQLDTTQSSTFSVLQFRVTSVGFSQTVVDNGNTVTRVSTLGELNDASPEPQMCPTTDGAILGLVSTAAVFTYETTVATGLIVGTSEEFDVLTFFQLNEPGVGDTLPLLIGTATISLCNTGCAKTENCATPGTGTNRKRRSAGDEPLDQRDTNLYTTLLVSADPRAAEQLQAELAAHAKSSTCEPISNMGYLIGMIVLAALLVFSVAVTVFMFSRMSRPRTDYPKA